MDRFYEPNGNSADFSDDNILVDLKNNRDSVSYGSIIEEFDTQANTQDNGQQEFKMIKEEFFKMQAQFEMSRSKIVRLENSLSYKSYNKSRNDPDFPNFSEFLETFDTLYCKIQDRMIHYERQSTFNQNLSLIQERHLSQLQSLDELKQKVYTSNLINKQLTSNFQYIYGELLEQIEDRMQNGQENFAFIEPTNLEQVYFDDQNVIDMLLKDANQQIDQFTKLYGQKQFQKSTVNGFYDSFKKELLEQELSVSVVKFDMQEMPDTVRSSKRQPRRNPQSAGPTARQQVTYLPWGIDYRKIQK